MTFPSEIIVEHFVTRGDCYVLQGLFKSAPWTLLLQEFCKEPDCDVLAGETY